MPWGLIPRSGAGQMGRLPNDHQSQRALGIDTRSRNLDVFRRTVAGGDRHRQFDDAATARQARLAPPEEIRASQVRQGRGQIRRRQKGRRRRGRRFRQFRRGPIVPDAGLGRQRQRATGIRRHAGRQRPGDDRSRQQHRAGRPAIRRRAGAAGAPVVAADQLNDVDRALQEGTPAAAPVALASADAPAATAPRRRGRQPAAKARPGTRPR